MCCVEEGVDNCGDFGASPEHSSSLWGPMTSATTSIPYPSLSLSLRRCDVHMRSNYYPKLSHLRSHRANTSPLHIASGNMAEQISDESRDDEDKQ